MAFPSVGLERLTEGQTPVDRPVEITGGASGIEQSGREGTVISQRRDDLTQDEAFESDGRKAGRGGRNAWIEAVHRSAFCQAFKSLFSEAPAFFGARYCSRAPWHFRAPLPLGDSFLLGDPCVFRRAILTPFLG